MPIREAVEALSQAEAAARTSSLAQHCPGRWLTSALQAVGRGVHHLEWGQAGVSPMQSQAGGGSRPQPCQQEGPVTATVAGLCPALGWGAMCKDVSRHVPACLAAWRGV